MRIAEALSARAPAGLDHREARLLLAQAAGLGEAAVLAHPERELEARAAARFLCWAARRAAGEPVAYLLGWREFYGLPLAVTPEVLIPRPETELLVELALERVPAGLPASVADLGTGSGAIALAIKRHRPQARVVAVDTSSAALGVARSNAAQLDLRIDCRQGEWCAPLAAERFDLLVSNPPYIAAHDPHLDEGDVRAEPRLALVSGEDGLDAIRAVAAQAPGCLRAGGWLLLEHGYDQAARVRALLAAAGLSEIGTWRDLAGIARVTGGRYNPDKFTRV